MKKYINIAKGNHVFIKKIDTGASAYDFSSDVEVDKVKYLIGNITSIGNKVDPEEGYEIGMLIKCADFVAVDFGNSEYGLNADDIIGETKLVEVSDDE